MSVPETLAPLPEAAWSSASPGNLHGPMLTHGCVVVRRVVAPALVAAVAADVARTLAEHEWVTGQPVPPVAAGPARNPGDVGFYRCYAALQSLESVHRLAHDPDLSALARRLVGDDAFVHACKVVRVGWPAALGGRPVGEHNDHAYIGGGYFVITWLPLVTCPPQSGGLRVLLGSHNRHEHTPPRWAATATDPGDVVVLHPLVIHAGLTNTTSTLRLSVDYRWQSTAEPLPLDAHLPHRHPHLPPWETLTASWSTTRWIDMPAALSPPPDDQRDVPQPPHPRPVDLPGSGPTQRRAQR